MVTADSDLTPAAPCACPACTCRARAIRAARQAGIALLTTVFSFDPTNGEPWTALVTSVHHRGVIARANACTEEEAVYAALRRIGVHP